MPAPLPGRGSGQRELESCEAQDWMRRILAQAGFTHQELQNIVTHSCKATWLSAAAKWGVAIKLRRLLGGHAKPSERSVLEYSRVALAAPLRKLSEVIDDVALGIFSRR